MFIGGNKLVLNETTICKAIEEYLNARISGRTNKVKVQGVSTDYSRGVKLFNVETVNELQEDEEDEEDSDNG